MHTQLNRVIIRIVVYATIYGGDTVNYHDRSVGRFISILYRRAQVYIANEMKAYGIGSGQFIFLSCLYEKEGISQEELSHLLMIDKGTTARAIQKLEQLGYVTREVNPDDRRGYQLFVTDKAIQLKPILYNILRSWTDRLVESLSEEEEDMIYSILEKMVTNTRCTIDEKKG